MDGIAAGRQILSKRKLKQKFNKSDGQATTKLPNSNNAARANGNKFNSNSSTRWIDKDE